MPESQSRLHRSIGFRSATALIIANVIGAGIFTTTGFQAAELGHLLLIFVLWIVGGLLAYCGALCYAELGASIPQAGAEYAYLRESYGEAFGFMSAFVSLLAGFSAPIAAALKSLVHYLDAWLPVFDAEVSVFGLTSLGNVLAIMLVWALVWLQLKGTALSIAFINFATIIKIGGIVLIILAALLVGNGDPENFSYVSSSVQKQDTTTRLAAMGTSLIFVMFCFSGWNAAAYVAAEMIEPQKYLPRALLLGTSIVTVLYLLLNAVYLYGANIDELAGKVEVGLVAARALFGEQGASLVTIVLVFSLLASASAMTFAGPRVSYALGSDVSALAILSKTNNKGTPIVAVILQGGIASILIVSGTVDQILQYAGFTLALTSALAVSCVIVLRIRQPELERPFKTWAYPFPPLFFLAATGWIMYWAFQGRPMESSLATLTVLGSGGLFQLRKLKQLTR